MSAKCLVGRLSVVIAVAGLVSPASPAQTQAAASFEVASIKPNRSGQEWSRFAVCQRLR